MKAHYNDFEWTAPDELEELAGGQKLWPHYLKTAVYLDGTELRGTVRPVREHGEKAPPMGSLHVLAAVQPWAEPDSEESRARTFVLIETLKMDGIESIRAIGKRGRETVASAVAMDAIGCKLTWRFPLRTPGQNIQQPDVAQLSVASSGLVQSFESWPLASYVIANGYGDRGHVIRPGAATGKGHRSTVSDVAAPDPPVVKNHAFRPLAVEDLRECRSAYAPGLFRGVIEYRIQRLHRRGDFFGFDLSQG